MTIEVLETVLIHEAVVFRFAVDRAAGSHGLAHQFIHFGAVFAGEANQHLSALRRVADRLGRELLKLGMRQEHHVDVFVDDHTRCGGVGELLVEVKPELPEELHRLGKIFDREIDEDFGVHEKRSLV